ncbi:hypothetical protein SOVF_183620 [Spinacia oleracea]|nr:hypothetical protein SOVF_183620 [Spinacia oleracea]
MSSVLAKLMGIDRPSTSNTKHRRHRVLSENYHQNIASVAKRERVCLYSDDADSDMGDSEDAVEFSGGTSVIDYETYENLLSRTERSFLTGRSFSSSSSSFGDRKRKTSVSEEINGMQLQGRNTLRSRNRIKSPVEGSLSSQEIAKQITGQVNHSIWHSCAELSRSRLRDEKSSENEDRGKMTLSAYLLDSEKKHEPLSFNPVNSSTSRESQKSRKQLSERWRTRKCSEEVRTSCVSKIQDEVLVTSGNGRNSVLKTSDGNLSSPFHTATVNGWPVFAARYLSKPECFPSAWLPRSRPRHFTFDKSWCLRPEKWDSNQCDAEEEKSGLKDIQSTSESSSLDSEKPCIHQEAPLILNGSSVELPEQKSYEDTFTVTRSLSRRSYSDTENSTYDEAHVIVNDTGGTPRKSNVSQDRIVESLPLDCNFTPGWENEEGADQQDKEMNMSTNFGMEVLSAKSTSCILLDDGEYWKNQLKNKNNASEPRSPVSSLEGPEACSQVQNLTVEVAEHLSVQVENDTHGFQRKFQLIETMSLESRSEGPEMAVSSEEGENEGSVGLYQNDPQIMEIYQTLIKESWDFSYVVDVVVESGLHMRDLEMESKTWCLQGYVLEPSVFDMLEKKYGKHMPWEKSDRRLLFDRLNSGLLDIFKPSVGLNTWKQPVTKRLSSRQKGQEGIEEELWSLLVNQQEEFKRESFDKLYIKEIGWLDLEEDTDLIVQEIQSLLLDELIDEFACEVISFLLKA